MWRGPCFGDREFIGPYIDLRQPTSHLDKNIVFQKDR